MNKLYSSERIPTNERILVTGAGGFIGSHLVKALLDSKANVTALLGHYDPHQPWEFQIPSFRMDIGDVQALDLSQYSTIIHLAGPPSVQDSFRNPKKHEKVHADGTAILAEAASEIEQMKFIYISSAEIYGASQPCAVNENGNVDPQSPYASAKLKAEHSLRAHHQDGCLDLIILRPFSVYGPGQSPLSLAAEICSQLEQSDSIVLRNPFATRDFCYVSDMVNALLLAIATPSKSSDHTPLTVNIGSGIGVSAKEVAMTLGEVLRRPVQVSNKYPDTHETTHTPVLIANITSAENILNWRPTVTLKEGLLNTALSYGLTIQ